MILPLPNNHDFCDYIHCMKKPVFWNWVQMPFGNYVSAMLVCGEHQLNIKNLNLIILETIGLESAELERLKQEIEKENKS